MTGPFRPSTGWPASAPGQGGQPPVHPTVGNHGMPGAPVQHEQPNNQNPPPQGFNGGQGWTPPAPPAPPQTFAPQNNNQQPNYAPAPPAPPAPHPTAPYGQGFPQSQPQNQPQNQGQPAAPQRAEIPDHVVLDGASVPPELRGRTWGQVKQIYGALANDFVLRSNANQPRPNAPQAPAAPVHVQGERNGGQPERQASNGFWENPGEFIERAIDQRLAPMTQRTTAMAIQEARQVAASGISDWAQLEGEVMSLVAGADGQALTDPRLWQSTADLARGRLMSRGEYRQGQPNGQPAQGQPMQNRGPGSYVPAAMNPVQPPQVGQFFTEAPTPPQYNQYGGQTNGDVQSRIAGLTNEQRAYAEKMQMTLEDYVAWQGGVIQSAPTRRY